MRTKKKTAKKGSAAVVSLAEAKTSKKSDGQKETVDDFSSDLIKAINKEHNDKIAFNLSVDDAPTNIKRWISTGSKILDYIISNQRDGGLPEGRIVEIQGPPSCHAKGDRVLMYDGTTKAIEDVLVGDRLMGPDSKPRVVKDLVRGRDELFKLTAQQHAGTYHVSKHHFLPLVKTKKNHNGPERIRIQVEDYLTKNKFFKNSYRLERRGVEFPNSKSDFIIPPYILGLLIGDGFLALNRVELTTADKEIEDEYKTFCESFGYDTRDHLKKGSKAKGIYHKTGWNPGKKFELEEDKDEIRSELRRLGLLNTTSGDKFIPQEYKVASTRDRLELLAGLIDTDGFKYKKENGETGSSYEISSKSLTLLNDMVFVARTAGLNGSEPHKKTVKGVDYWRVVISGEIPCRLPRKKSSSSSNTSKHIHGFTLTSIGEGEIYGVTVDHEDHQYLMSDTTIQENCGKSHIGFELAKSTQRHGGIVVYIDTENATNLLNLKKLGIDVANRFVFVQTACTEEIFQVMESTIIKAKNMAADVPVTIIWDSIAASSPKAELEGDFDQNTIGLQARVLGKGLRKITNLIGNKKVLLVLMNQQRMKIGVMYGDPCVDPSTKIAIRKHI